MALVGGWPYVWIAVAIRWPNPSSLSCIESGNASYVLKKKFSMVFVYCNIFIKVFAVFNIFVFFCLF